MTKSRVSFNFRNILQSAATSAIRNIVSRSKHLVEPFIELEGLLNEAIQMHPKASDNIKSALRDLGLKVHLKEEWTGTEKLTIKDWRKNNALSNSSWYFQSNTDVTK